MKREISIKSLEELGGVATAILESLNGRNVVLLNGGMGAGKTTLVREIAAQLGSADNVTSPTFAIVNEYVAGDGESFFHFDMYRIERLEEAIDMGFTEYLDSGCLCFIEWSERVEELLPEDVVVVTIDAPTETDRSFIIE
ncbi:MAG: tRNA (adenosine(37)-N6)-threonylcarbamoyltransferase complex ATPase subunit type 1 TsaE [Rikenellaceae bacterium]